MIQFENITKSYGTHTLFENVNFQVNPRERVGVVGRNGHGKTTLFRLVVNEERPDTGSIIIPKQYRVGYVQQVIDFKKKTVLEECMTGLMAHERDHHWKAEKILSGLGFTKDDVMRSPLEFSGGFQVRLNLAKVLVSEPDFLLLDEPTNYLDITSIRWMERFLVGWPHEVMLITHDRGFMDKVVTHILGIHRKRIRKMVGDTGKYYAQIAQEEEIHEKTRINDEKREKEVQLFITRFRAKARLANMVQSRVKALAKREKREKLEKLKTLEFSFKSKPFHGKYVFTAKDVSFSYNTDKPLIHRFNITVGPRDRVCVIGKNGKGKTTLLKLLAGVLTPQKGDITYHPVITKGLYEQTQVDDLVDTRNVVEEILYSNSDVDLQAVRDICAGMMFEGDAALKKIQVLSGGEKSRLILGKLLVTPVNLLILDEPTNHLDLESTDAMLAAINNFNGAVIIVTHNEMFLHTIATRLIVFQDKGLEVFEGGYQDFLDKAGWQEEDSIVRTVQGDAEKDGGSNRPTKKEIKRIRSHFLSQRAKDLNPLKERIKETEKQIEYQERKLEELSHAMQAATEAKNSTTIENLSKSIFTCQSAIDRLFDELETVTETFEVHVARFDKELERLEIKWK